MNRLVATTRLGITTSNILDAAGQLLTETRKGTDGTVITLRRLGYDKTSFKVKNLKGHVYLLCI